MSYFSQHPGARWMVPAAAVAVTAGVVVTTQGSAFSSSGLEPRTAEQLLVDLQKATPVPMSGEVSQTLDLGLPDLSGLGGGTSAHGGSALDPLTLLGGTHTWRVWYGGEARQRVALVDGSTETAIIRNGSEGWMWSSADKSAVHATLPAHESGPAKAHGGLPDTTTPEAAARAVLERLDPSTQVTTTTIEKVAGRPVYGLVLVPKATDTLVGDVEIAVDAQTHLPLAVTVTPKGESNPAVDVRFTRVDMTAPAASLFSFTPPPGTEVTEAGAETDGAASKTRGHDGPAASEKRGAHTGHLRGAHHTGTAVVGEGWSAITTGTLPEGALGTAASTGETGEGNEAGHTPPAALDTLMPDTSGSWGTGRVLQTRLGTLVVTDDGRYAAGLVSSQAVQAALVK